jgi:hypothetical protein
LVSLVLPPGKAVAFLAVQLAVFGLYMGASFGPNHIGLPLVSPKLKLYSSRIANCVDSRMSNIELTRCDRLVTVD